MAAKKPAIAVPASYDAANALLLEYGRTQQQLAREDARLAQAVARLTVRIETRATPLKARLKALEEQIAAYAAAERNALTDEGKVKFHDMPAGRIGWRTNPPSIDLKSGWKIADVVKEVLKMGLRRKFLRMKLELNKEAMLEDQDKALTVPGVRVKQAEAFYLEPVGAKLSGGEP